MLLLAESTLIKESLGLYTLAQPFNQWAETCPVQLKLHSYILICIYIDQSKQLHYNQSDPMKLSNWDRQCYMDQTV